MAKWNDTSLVQNSSQSGAAIGLRGPAKDSRVIEYGDFEIETVANSSTLVIRKCSEPAAEYEELVDAAQVGLDLYMIKVGIPLAIDQPRSSYVRWWHEGDELVVRAVSVVSMAVDVPPVKLTVTNSQGEDVTSPDPALNWHLSLRHYRLSQLTSDTTDSYRHLYLAVEAILSDIFPHQGGGEKQWTVDAFNEAHRRYGLEKFSSHAAGQAQPGVALHTDFAEQARHLINHSKTNKPHMVPMDLADREQLQETHRRLSDLCVHLLREHLALGRAGGAMFPAFFQYRVEEMLKDSMVTISDSDVQPSASDREVIIPSNSAQVRAPTVASAQPLEKWIHTIEATFSSRDLVGMDRFTSWWVVMKDETPYCWADFDGHSLELTGVARLEVVTGLSLVNVRHGRTDFAT